MTNRVAVAAAVLIRGQAADLEIFSARRTEPPMVAGGWEFPGGKVDAPESILEALHRELKEELGVTVTVEQQVRGPLPDHSWAMTDKYALHVFVCRLIGDQEPQLLEDHDQMAWLPLDSAASAVPWLSVDLPILEAAIALLRT